MELSPLTSWRGNRGWLRRPKSFAVALPRGQGAMRLVWIELLFRILVGGFQGSLLQAFRGAPPASRCAGPSAGESDEHPDDPPDRPLIRKGEAS
jgi:hypothetical protein